jgi:peptidyl-prolyl cis-trans isomerase D
MLQALREKTSGWIAFIILASVGVPFAFFGINNYFETQTESFVARVGKEEISPQEFRDRLELLRSQARQQQGPGFDGSYFNDPTVKRQVLDRMIDEKLLSRAARASVDAAHADGALRWR